MRPFACPFFALLALFAAGGFVQPGRAAAQLRPLDPVAWEVFAPGVSGSVEVAVGRFGNLRASLAGTTGTLLELGGLRATWRTGRVALEASGTVLRLFEDESVFAAPAGDARLPAGERRVDAGDWEASTTVRLTSEGARVPVVLRFGTRLPTTDNRVGLERDATDFFSTVAARLVSGGFSAAGELGLGIHGTREARYEQSDVLLFAATLSHRLGRLAPSVAYLGHVDGLKGREVRGNEDLRELRVGLRAGGRRWLRAEVVHGFTRTGPGWGVVLGLGSRFGSAIQEN